MRLAITGTTGRVGRALAQGLQDGHEIIELPRTHWDLGHEGWFERLEALDFDILLNPAAVTSLEACEANPELARAANAEAPVAMARLCERLGRRMLQFSTDYVLDGSTAGLHAETAPVLPLSVYAETKAAAEAGVVAAGGCVVRVSWVFGPEKPAFPDQIVDRALAGEPLQGIADKTSMPCFTRDLVRWIRRLIELGPPNEVLHGCNAGPPVSWHGIAEVVRDHLVARGRVDGTPAVMTQRLADMVGFKAVRPRHTAMSTRRMNELIGEKPRDWREALVEHLDGLLQSR